MATAWLGLGANIGEPEAQVKDAIARLDTAQGISVSKRSGIIITKPWGKTDQPDFCNAVIEVETNHFPLDLLDACLGIEQDMGRVRIEHWGPRVIDIDVIAYEREIINEDRLRLPHPYATERDFVMEPLREIAPDTADWLNSLKG